MRLATACRTWGRPEVGRALSRNGMRNPFGTGGSAIAFDCINSPMRGPRMMIRADSLIIPAIRVERGFLDLGFVQLA